MSVPDLLDHIDEIVYVKAGDVIFEEGERGNFMYLIVTGEVEAWRRNRRLAIRGPGEIIGEVAFFDGGKRSAKVVACKDCKLARIDQAHFEELVRNVPDFVRLLLARLEG